MLAREIDVVGLPGIEHRRAQQFSDCNQGLNRRSAFARLLGDDDRILGLAQHARQVFDRRRLCRRRNGEHGRGRIGAHRLHQELGRHRDEDRTFRRRHRQLAGALHGMRQDHARVESEAPFHTVLHEARRPADIGEQPQPLAPHDRVRALGKTDRFAGQHHHRNALMQRGAHAHRGVKRADRGVQHERRKLPGRLGVSRGHAHRGFFMARGKIFRNIGPMQLRKRLPERRPVRAGRGKDPLDAHRAQHAQERFGSAQTLHWPMPSSGISFA